MEQIDLLYHHTTPRKSVSYRAAMLEQHVREKDLEVSTTPGGGSRGGGLEDDNVDDKGHVLHSERV